MSKPNGRIPTKLRQALVKPVSEYAKVQNLSFNLVMGAVLWAGERLNQEPGFRLTTAKGQVARLSRPTLIRLISPTVIAKYQTELERREQAAQNQINSVIRNAIPRHLRQEEFIRVVTAEINLAREQNKGMALPQIKELAQKRAALRESQETLPFAS